MLKKIMAGTGAVSALIAVHAVHAEPQSAVQVGKIMTFRDWTVGCDNGLACQAVSLANDTSTEEALSVVIARRAGVNALLTIEMAGFTSKADRYRVVVDGKIAATGIMQTGSKSITLSGAPAVKLGRVIAKGRAVRLIDGSGMELGTASLSGISAALRYIDAEQGRAGSRGAVIAIGPKMGTAKAGTLPIISARKIVPTNILPDASALVALSENSPCSGERFGSTEDTAYSLGSGPDGPQALIMLNCGAGAYNFSTGIYVGQRDSSAKWTFSPARFDYGASGFSADSKIPLLVNANWDAATQTISSLAKARGLGDCGSAESWVWDGKMFRLISATAMGECRRSRDWIPIWRAEVRLIP